MATFQQEIGWLNNGLLEGLQMPEAFSQCFKIANALGKPDAWLCAAAPMKGRWEFTSSTFCSAFGMGPRSEDWELYTDLDLMANKRRLEVPGYRQIADRQPPKGWRKWCTFLSAYPGLRVPGLGTHWEPAFPDQLAPCH